MALIKVERFIHHPTCEISKVYVRGTHFCYAIEDAQRTTKIKGETCIPLGTYDLGLRYSPKFSKRYAVPPQRAEDYKMIWVQNVPGYEYILIHTGNTISDTEGCLILGSSINVTEGRESVGSSKVAYTRFYAAVIDEIKKGGQRIEYTTI